MTLTCAIERQRQLFDLPCANYCANLRSFCLDPKAGSGDAHVIRADAHVLNTEASSGAGGGPIICTRFLAGDSDRDVGNDAAGAIEHCACNGAAVRLSSSRYSGECKEKTEGKKPQQGQIESHPTPKKAPITEQTLYFADDRI